MRPVTPRRFIADAVAVPLVVAALFFLAWASVAWSLGSSS